jgi:hypothetical protein
MRFRLHSQTGSAVPTPAKTLEQIHAQLAEQQSP